ncbi:hypothetical protein EMCRGX_G024860 [Ephydatia muelleri]
MPSPPAAAAAAAALPLPPPAEAAAELPPTANSSRAAPHRQQQQSCPHRQQQSCPHLQQQKQEHRYLHQPHQYWHQYWHQCPHHHFACCHPGRCHHHSHGSHGRNQAAAAIEEAGGEEEDKEEPTQAMDGNDGVLVTEKYERTFFVIDISKLKREDDQLVNAKLVFRPEERYQKNEQLCSQLIGLSVCTMNLTGQYPQYLKLRGSGYAIKALGEDCIMGLSTLPTSQRGGDEPVASVVQALKLIHDLFVFFYHSPDMVKKQAGERDWAAVCTSMTAIFSNILAYVEHDSKSVASMLNPLPYGKYTMQSSIEARLFLLSSRLLKHCQKMQPSINVGCIFHRNKGSGLGTRDQVWAQGIRSGHKGSGLGTRDQWSGHRGSMVWAQGINGLGTGDQWSGHRGSMVWAQGINGLGTGDQWSGHRGSMVWAQGINGLGTGDQWSGHRGSMVWAQGINGLATGDQWSGHRGSMVWAQGINGLGTGDQWSGHRGSMVWAQGINGLGTGDQWSGHRGSMVWAQGINGLGTRDQWSGHRGSMVWAQGINGLGTGDQWSGHRGSMVWAQGINGLATRDQWSGHKGSMVWAQGINGLGTRDQWSGHRGSMVWAQGINGLGTGDQWSGHRGSMVWAQGINGLGTGDQWSGHRGSMVWAQGINGLATGDQWSGHRGSMVWAQGINGLGTGDQGSGHRGSMVWAQGIKGLATGDQWSGHRGSRINGLGLGDQGQWSGHRGIKDQWSGPLEGIKGQWSGHRGSRINTGGSKTSGLGLGNQGSMVWAQGIKDQWSGLRGSRINGLGTGDQGSMIFCSHLPTSLTEKLLLLVHTKTKDMYIELSLKPLFAEEISGHVWMIPVYLLQDEEEELKAYRRNMSDHDSVYNTLRSSTGSLPFSSGASFFARFSHSNPPRASKKGGVVHTKAQVSPQASTRRSIFHRSTDVDRTYEDVTDAVEVLKQSKLQTKMATRIPSGDAQVLAASTPGVQLVRQTSDQESSTPSGSAPPPAYDAVMSGNYSATSTPQSGGLNATAFYSPNESFSQASLSSSKFGPLGTPEGKDPPAKPHALAEDNDFMESSEIEKLIKRKNRDRAPSDAPPPLPPPPSDAPPPLPPRMGDYENSDTLLKGGTNKETAIVKSTTPKGDSVAEEVPSQDQPPPIIPRQTSLPMVPPPQPSVTVNTRSIYSDDVSVETSDERVARGSDEGVVRGSDEGVVRGSDEGVARGSDEGVARGSDEGEVRDSDGGEAEDRNGKVLDGSGLLKVQTHHTSNNEVSQVTMEDSNTTDPGNLQTDTVTQQRSVGVDEDVPTNPAHLTDGSRGGCGSPNQQEVALDMEASCPIPVPSNSAPYVEVSNENPSVQPQVSLDMENVRTGADDGKYSSPMGSEEEEDEYVPSWQIDNREWGLAKTESLKEEEEEERARLKEEEAGLKGEKSAGTNGATAKEEEEEEGEEEEEEMVPQGEREDEQMGVSADHKILPPVAHVLRPVARTGEGCSVHAVQKYLFLQNYMNTTVVLLADEGLQNERDQLRELFTTLLVHQSAIEETLTQHSEVAADDKLPASRAMYRSVDRKCETTGNVGHGQFRHALRRAHQEYQHDPSLLQISMSKDGRTTLSRCVLGREVYVHCKRNPNEDALQTLPTVENMIRGGRGGSRDEEGSEPHGMFL